ncbi:hypothetical protein PS910_02693 [Pseudomonas fluorescens]|nr:hypothetical protein PS910_02693 [Pseudomonas fluorescens]
MTMQPTPSTWQYRFAQAYQITDFAANSKAVSGYDVWNVQCIRDGQHVELDGPFFTEDEARISADLLRGTFRGARAYSACHCAAWNPDPGYEQLIRDQALMSRSLLACRLGVELVTSAEEK